MDKTMLEQWEEIAAQVCGLDSAKDAATKHNGLCNLLALVYKDLSVVLSQYVDDILATAKGRELSFTTYKDAAASPLVGKVIELITKHAAEVEQWEKDDDTTLAERLRKLDEYEYSDKLDWQIIAEGLSAMGLSETRGTPTDPDRIYYKNGSFRQYWRYRLTGEYKLLRALQPHTDSDDELETLYKSVCLYASLTNEKVKVEALIDVLGNTPQNAQNVPNFATIPHCCTFTHPEGVNAKIERFLSVVPSKNHKKAGSLLRRVIKAGYCNENYYWDASKWGKGKGKSRLALVCFCYEASRYLKIKPYEYTHNKNKFESESRDATNWQAFEMLFEYDGKKADKHGKYHQLADNWKDKCKYNEQERFYKTPEMIKIKKLFRA